MGWYENQKAKSEGARERREERKEELQAMREAATTDCPAPDSHYATEVNRGSINMGSWQFELNQSYKRGYRLAHVFEQDGNTVQVFEHNHP